MSVSSAEEEEVEVDMNEVVANDEVKLKLYKSLN
jgi:hypothetical protein